MPKSSEMLLFKALRNKRSIDLVEIVINSNRKIQNAATKNK